MSACSLGRGLWRSAGAAARFDCESAGRTPQSSSPPSANAIRPVIAPERSFLEGLAFARELTESCERSANEFIMMSTPWHSLFLKIRHSAALGAQRMGLTASRSRAQRTPELPFRGAQPCRPLGGRRTWRSKSCALNWDNHGCSHSGKRCSAERCRSLLRDAACRWVQGVVGVSDMDSIAGCFHLHSQKSPSRTARPEQTGGCAAPAVLIPERFRIYRCVAPSVAARVARAALSSRLI